MSKIDELKSMSRASEAATAPAPPSEIDKTRIEAGLMVLSLQEEARIKNSQELIQLLRELQRSTSQAAREIGTAAHQVRDYPVEVLNQHRARMEQCLAKCEAAAIASKEYFDKSRAVMDGYGKELRADSWWLASVTSGYTAIAFMLLFLFLRWLGH